MARLEVPAHPLGSHDESFHEPGEAVEHVVEREERVGDHDALGRRVRDVALVPERDVLEPDERSCARTTRASPQIRSATTGFRLCGIADEPFWPRPNGSCTSRDLGAREMPDLERERVERRGDDRERREELGMAVALEDLGRGRRRLEAEPLARDPLELGIGRRVRADGARELADAHPLERARDALARPRSSSKAQPASLSPNVVGSAWTPCVRPICSVVAVLLGACDDGGEGAVEPLEDQRARPRGSAARARCRRRPRR